MNTYQVIESIAISYNSRIFQYAGYWYMLPLGGYLDEDTDWTHKLLVSTAPMAAPCPTWPKAVVLETDYKALADMTISYFQPFKQTLRSQLYYGGSTTDVVTNIPTPHLPDRGGSRPRLRAELQGARDRRRPHNQAARRKHLKQQPSGTVPVQVHHQGRRPLRSQRSDVQQPRRILLGLK